MATATHRSENVDYHIQVAGNFQKACDGILDWIQREDLKKEQIISISASETSTLDADAVLTVIYRHQKEVGMTSLSDLRFELLKNTSGWDEQYKQLEQTFQNQRVDVVSHTHTARNIGQINIQIVWYIPSSEANAYTCKHLSN